MKTDELLILTAVIIIAVAILTKLIPYILDLIWWVRNRPKACAGQWVIHIPTKYVFEIKFIEMGAETFFFNYKGQRFLQEDCAILINQEKEVEEK